MFSGVLKKMTSIHDNPVRYILDFDNDLLFLNQIIGKNIKIHKTGYCCLSCFENLQIFANGFCKKCFFESPMSGDWIMKPELSKAHLEIEDRDISYEKKVQLQNHIVYLSKTSGIKVGVTRSNNMSTRWIDQGAHQAIELVEVPNRFLAGITEVAIKEFISDKTNWRKMLTNDSNELDIMSCKEDIKKHIPIETLDYYIQNNSKTDIDFPVNEYPIKPLTQKLIKTQEIKGTLKGIKGQYLIFEENKVFNVRSHEGFVVEVSF